MNQIIASVVVAYILLGISFFVFLNLINITARVISFGSLKLTYFPV